MLLSHASLGLLFGLAAAELGPPLDDALAGMGAGPDETTLAHTLASAAGVGSPHFPASGMSGADLYALDEAVDPPAWKYVGTRQNLQSGTAQSGSVATNLPTDRMTSYRLYLPTYNTVVDGAIGVPQGSTIQLDSRAGFKEPAVVCKVPYSNSLHTFEHTMVGGLHFTGLVIVAGTGMARAFCREASLAVWGTPSQT